LFVASRATSSDADGWVNAILRRRGGIASGAAAHWSGGIFRTLDELKLAGRIPQDQFECLRSSLTTYTGMQSVDLRFASPLVRRDFADLGTGQAGNSAKSADPPFEQGSLGGRILSITVKIDDADSEFVRESVLRITGDPHNPVLVLRSQKGDQTIESSTNCGF
jgi:hypothetical protein